MSYDSNHYVIKQIENVLRKDQELKDKLYSSTLNNNDDDELTKLKYKVDILEMRVNELSRALSLVTMGL